MKQNILIRKAEIVKKKKKHNIGEDTVKWDMTNYLIL